MKKKIMITVASLAALGAAVAGYLHFSGRTPFGHSYFRRPVVLFRMRR